METIACPECGGKPSAIKPYRLGYGAIRWTERYFCRVCAGRGVVVPQIAALYAAGKLPMPILYETWKKFQKKVAAEVDAGPTELK